MSSPSTTSRHPWTDANGHFFASSGMKISKSNSPEVSQSDESASESSAPEPKKRQPPRSITLNACTNCKKARTKCDGGRPNCSRCISRQISQPCQYVLHTKAAKEEMMAAIRQLQEELRQLRQQNKNLSERNDMLETIFRSLKDDTHRQQVISHLQREDDYQRVVDRLGQTSAVAQNLAPQPDLLPTQFYQQYNDEMREFPQYWQSSSQWNWMDMNSSGG
ncbi:MAG: hypothetical protein Q9224_002334 [Gallowayella concinna]